MRVESSSILGNTQFSVKDPRNYHVYLDGVRVPHLAFMADEELGEVWAHECYEGGGVRIVNGEPVELRLTGKVEIRYVGNGSVTDPTAVGSDDPG